MFVCINCNYSTEIKCNYHKHLKTKKHLKNTKGLSSEQLKSINNCPKMPQNAPKLPQNAPKLPQNAPNCPKLPQNCPKLPQNAPNSNKTNIMCEFCSKTYSKKSHLTRHLKTCKAKKSIVDVDYKKLYEDMKSEKIKSEENKSQIISELTKQLERVIDKVGNTHITQNNIILTCYGKENLEHITDNYKIDLLKLPYSMIPRLIKDVHFNSEYPENNNIYIPNKKEPYVKVFSNNKWIYKDKNSTISELIDKNYHRLDEFYQLKGKNKLREDQQNRYLEFQTKKETNNDELIKDVKKNIEIILINNDST